MATFDEVFSDAIQELEERGLLLNMHLLDLVGGDEKLMQSVRDALIQNGLAHDRYGVGLAKSLDFDTLRAIARIQPAPIDSTTDPSDEIVFAGVSEAECDWWLMSGGATSGPFSLETLIQMRQLGEVSDIDMIRDGRHGMWLIPRDVVELAGIAPARRPSAKTTSAFVDRPSVQVKTTHEPVSSRSQPILAKPGARQAPILST